MHRKKIKLLRRSFPIFANFYVLFNWVKDLFPKIIECSFSGFALVFLPLNMTLNYQRKISKPFQGYRIDFAIQSIKAGSSIRLASRNFNVPYSTLRRTLKTNVERYALTKVGRPSFLTDYQQRTIFKALTFHSSTFSQLRKKIFTFVGNMNVKMPISWKRNRTAGMDWTLSFLNRFISLKMFVKKGKSYHETQFTCVNCVRLMNRSLVKFVCENCCLCTCKNCFAREKYQCCPVD